MRKRQHIIYLDQFAVSNLILGEGIWQDINFQLVNAVKNGKVLCPIPLEHFVETVGMKRSNAIQQDRFFKSISRGKRFLAWDEIAANEIMLYTKFKKNKPILADYIKVIDGDYDLEDDATYHKHRLIREQYLSYKEIEKKSLSTFQQLSHEKNDSNEAKVSMSKEEKKEKRRQKKEYEANEEALKDALSAFVVKPYIEFFREVCIGKKLSVDLMKLSRPEQRIALLLCQQRFTGRNFFSASNDFQKNLFNNIPSLYTYYSLKMYYTNNHMKEKANDAIDWERISSGIFISNIMLVDKRQKYALQSMGIDKKYGTILYSDVEDDLTAFKGILEQLNR